jgi:hypothetical protein
MKFPPVLRLSGVILFAGTLLATEQDSLEEKIDDPSPDKKFAVRTSYDPSLTNDEDVKAGVISWDATRAIDLVAMPSKEVVLNLATEESRLAAAVWSQDSKWLAYALSGGQRVTDAYVCRKSGDKFEAIKAESLTVDAGGSPRNQYVTPLRWLKPGTLVLKQYTIFRGGDGESTIEFTVRFDQNGKFHVTNRKKVKNEDE